MNADRAVSILPPGRVDGEACSLDGFGRCYVVEIWKIVRDSLLVQIGLYDPAIDLQRSFDVHRSLY